MSTFQFDPKTATLEQAKHWLREQVNGGAKCPCCTQFAKIYKRKMEASKALALILFCRQLPSPGGEWTHIPTFLKRGGGTHQEVLRSREWTRLRYFGLLEPRTDEPEDSKKKTSGFWRLTPLGMDFALRLERVPAYVTVYDERILSRSPETVSIDEALGKKFNYKELMETL